MSGRTQQLFEKVLLAPGIRNWRERRFDSRFRQGSYLGAFRGIFATFNEAARAAPAEKALGYDHEEPASLYRERMDRVYPGDYPMMFWLGKTLEQGANRVFDLGGHVGISYYAYQNYLRYPDTLLWQVLDVPAVAKAGREIASQRDTRRALTFVDDLQLANEADVFFTAGCLQYMAPTLADQLGQLRNLPRWVLVNLLPLHDTHEYWTLQSINGAFCPYRVQRRARFFADVGSLGYETVDRWENAEKGCAVAFQPEFSVQGYAGAAFRLK